MPRRTAARRFFFLARLLQGGIALRRLWLLYLCLIFGLSSIPGSSLGQGAPIYMDKVAHFLLYAGLTWLYASLGFARHWRGWALLLSALLLAATVGVADEFYQELIPGRTCELSDWLADCAGGLVGALPALGLRRLRGLNGEKDER